MEFGLELSAQAARCVSCGRQAAPLQGDADLAADHSADRNRWTRESLVARELTYLDFDVLLERGHRGRLPELEGSERAPAGQTPVAFTVPFLAGPGEHPPAAGRPRRRPASTPRDRRHRPSRRATVPRALFHDQLEVDHYPQPRRGGRPPNRRGLPDPPAHVGRPGPARAALGVPLRWDRMVTGRAWTHLVRYLEVSDPSPSPCSPLQILVMIAGPSDYPQLDVSKQKEWTQLRPGLAPLEQANQVQGHPAGDRHPGRLRQQLRRADAPCCTSSATAAGLDLGAGSWSWRTVWVAAGRSAARTLGGY